MTNREIRDIAMKQSAIDANCDKNDFIRKENIITASAKNPGARKYLQFPIPCMLITYGTNIVASIDMEYKDIVERYIEKYPIEHCFETPNLHVLNKEFEKHDMQVCFMAEYFLPDMDKIPDLKCEYELRILGREDFAELYIPQWSNALCKERKELDVLGVGAYKDGKLVGLAGGSADCDEMWQIGVDVLQEERRKGVASALTSRLALEILDRDKVPFYCCAWSNIKSARNAVKSGFRPAWAELAVKPRDFVEKMNG